MQLLKKCGLSVSDDEQLPKNSVLSHFNHSLATLFDNKKNWNDEFEKYGNEKEDIISSKIEKFHINLPPKKRKTTSTQPTQSTE